MGWVHDCRVSASLSVGSVQAAQTVAESLLCCTGRRWRHVQGVAAAADRLATKLGLGAEGEAVRVAAWLHDIGYAPSLVATGFHPVDGARFLRAQGTPELVVSLVAHHSGAAFEAEQRGLSDELAEFVAPPAALLDVVTYADLTTSPDGAAVTVARRLSEILARYAEDSAVHRAVVESSPLLLAAADRVEERLALSGA